MVVVQGLSPQLEKVVPCLEGCEIVQSLPVSAILGGSREVSGIVYSRRKWSAPWGAVGKDKACLYLLVSVRAVAQSAVGEAGPP